MEQLVVSEIFGPTVQGEGPSCGRRAAFVRLGLYNLDCPWCDTPYTWDWQGKNGPPQSRADLVSMAPAEILAVIVPLDVDLVVITGGEPMLQRVGLGPLVTSLVRTGHRVEVETNGTILPNDLLLAVVDQWNVSPKLPHSGVDLDRAWKPEVLRELADTERAALKVVCKTPEDVDLVADLIAAHHLPFDRSEVWVMPEGIDGSTIETHAQAIARTAIDHGYNLTTRLHVMVWGNERGV